ncbi:helix-turn-helix domain-containing protein [Streptomyces hygroscopicus]|uniref:helix-turn-helix domain-containing protein n=1 Tax=Streptomyces hygroscopicus TaxID=1912 RepID=UPI0033FBA9C7
MPRTPDLLALFDESHRSRTVRELIDASGPTKSTVVRLVATLEQRGLPVTLIVPGRPCAIWS